MYQYKPLNDTIAAIATPAGQGGIGIVRISGPQALAIADRLVRLKSAKKPSACKGSTVHYGWVVEGGRFVDEVLLMVMRGPKSYTAEDVVEISGHGGPAIIREILDLTIQKDCRLAEPGEFTKRAFLNGRIDLAQAEAVLDIINAKTQAFARVSQNQLKGELSSELEEIRAGLMSVYTHIEALINFPEDDVEDRGRRDVEARLKEQEKRIQKLIASSHNGRLLKEGVRIVLCGKPNVGKSSLLNVLLKQDRAIVTDIAGTTRDVLEETAQIKGIPFQLVDTAGILEPRDLIEEEAVKRSHLFIDSADLILVVLDNSRPLEDADWQVINKVKSRNVLWVINKSDLGTTLDDGLLPAGRRVFVSALRKISIEQLEAAIVKSVWQKTTADGQDLLVSNIRHLNALKAAGEFLAHALQLTRGGDSWEFVSQDIKDAVNHLDSITGRNIDEDLLDRIFAEFCIGK